MTALDAATHTVDVNEHGRLGTRPCETCDAEAVVIMLAGRLAAFCPNGHMHYTEWYYPNGATDIETEQE